MNETCLIFMRLCKMACVKTISPNLKGFVNLLNWTKHDLCQYVILFFILKFQSLFIIYRLSGSEGGGEATYQKVRH